MSDEQTPSRFQSFYRRWQVFRDSVAKDIDFIQKFMYLLGLVILATVSVLALWQR